MLRGEKRPLPVDSGPPTGVPTGGGGANGSALTPTSVSGSVHVTGHVTGVGGGGGGGGIVGTPHKKAAKEKMPDFDWSADNYALTWRLVEELRKPENRNVLFPDHENLSGAKSGDTKEDVYRRIAKVVHPGAYAQDQQIAGSRMKNKTVAMWKEYSGYCRRLQDLCTAHQVDVPSDRPDETFPQEVQSEWRKIIISMPAFPALRNFMPVRPEEKSKTAIAKVQRGVSGFAPVPLEEDIAVDHHRDGVNSISYSGPVQSPPMKRASVTREVVFGAAEGHQDTMNGRDYRVPSHQQLLKISLTDYLELRRSYQEDVRLGIFTPSEAKIRIEGLDKQRTQAESTRSMLPPPSVHPPPPPSSTAASVTTTTTTPGGYAQPLTPHTTTRGMTPDPMQERVYEEKAYLLGFRKPMHQHPISHLSSKEIFRIILEHAAECELQECRLDNLRKTPQLSFIQGASGLDIVFMTRSGLVPLIQHPLAACVRFLARNTIHVLDVPLAINVQNNFETTMWDFANIVLTAALRRRLSIEEIKAVQANSPIVSADPAFRQQLQLLNESSTFFDVLRTGLLSPNNWIPMSQYDENMDHPVPQH